MLFPTSPDYAEALVTKHRLLHLRNRRKRQPDKEEAPASVLYGTLRRSTECNTVRPVGAMQ